MYERRAASMTPERPPANRRATVARALITETSAAPLQAVSAAARDESSSAAAAPSPRVAPARAPRPELRRKIIAGRDAWESLQGAQDIRLTYGLGLEQVGSRQAA